MMGRFSSTRQKLVLASLVVALSATSAWSISWWGKRDNREGLLTMVNNRVILFPEEGAAKAAALNDAFQINDRIKTRSRSAARILFMEDSFLNIGADTTYVLTKSRYDEVTGARDMGFSLAVGKVRLAVGRLFGRGSASVDTPTAVVGVKGTDVHIGYDERMKRTFVLVFQGSVDITSKNPALAGIVTTVKAGSYTEVDDSATPPEVQPAPASLVESTINSTDVFADPPRTTPDVPIADASIEPPGLDSGAGTDISDAHLNQVSQTAGSIASSTSTPATAQTDDVAGLDQPAILPPPVPPVTTTPPDQCPNCP